MAEDMDNKAMSSMSCLCCPLPGRTCTDTAAHVHPLSRDQPSTTMSGDEGEAGREDRGGVRRRRQRRSRVRGRSARARINFPDPEFISSISTHTHAHHALAWPPARRTLMSTSAFLPLCIGINDVFTAAFSRPVIIRVPREDIPATEST